VVGPNMSIVVPTLHMFGASMQISAEMRWYWSETVPGELIRWFNESTSHGCISGGGGEPRKDSYLLDPMQAQLGMKIRGKKKGVEIKGLVETIADGCKVKPFAGQIEIWTKWTTEALSFDDKKLIIVDKFRRLRKFDTSCTNIFEICLDKDEQPKGSANSPNVGCNVELTTIRIENRRWATLGFESFGTLGTVVDSLCRTVSLLASRDPPPFDEGWLASYPLWLQRGYTKNDL